jgi:two-component system response regulator MprA
MHSGNVDQRPRGADTLIRALVIEDDAGTAAFVRLGLAYEGFDVAYCADGAAAVRVAERMRPDVVVLDWMLPGMDGLEVCRRIRARGDAAILMLTAKDGLADRVLALDNGADDYLVKPFEYEELVARIRAVLRRRGNRSGQALQFADLQMDPSTRDVRRGTLAVDLTPREFDLLHLLLEQPRHVHTKRSIIERVWGYDYSGDENIVEVYVGYLRQKLHDRGPQFVVSVTRCETTKFKLHARPALRRRWGSISLTARLTTWYVGLLAFMLMGLGTMVYVSLGRLATAGTILVAEQTSNQIRQQLMRPASDRRVPLPVANVKCNDGLGEFCRG